MLWKEPPDSGGCAGCAGHAGRTESEGGSTGVHRFTGPIVGTREVIARGWRGVRIVRTRGAGRVMTPTRLVLIARDIRSERILRFGRVVPAQYGVATECSILIHCPGIERSEMIQLFDFDTLLPGVVRLY